MVFFQIALLLVGVVLTVAVLMQHGKSYGLSGTIAGGAETFFGKQKGKSMDAMFNKLTTVIAIVFVVLVLVLYFIAPGATTDNNVSGPNTPDTEDVSGPNLPPEEDGEGAAENAGEGAAENAGEDAAE